mgnify:CR=1 FL=1
MFEENAVLILILFAAIYIGAQLAVSNLEYFQRYSRLKQSFLVKVIALAVFVPVVLIFVK